jgi:trk/ktr system potassium uptake protein
MQIKIICRLIGLLLMIFSVSMLTPITIDIIYNEHAWHPFILAFIVTIMTGFICWYPVRNVNTELKIRDGFLIVVLFWVVLCLFASLPLLIAIAPAHSFTDAIFESVSGFTTTGASIIRHLDNLPHSILFYRQQLQFLGGMGIIVLAVAILPMLGVGGMQLYRAETPGPLKDSKLTPRIAQTAKALWVTYLLLTFFCAIAYWLFGMSLFDAIGESFSTVSTGGFSMHDSSFAHYNSDAIELIACVFMVLGGTNFGLHFIALKKRTLSHYWADEEFRWYIRLLLFSSLVIAVSLIVNQYFSKHHHAIVKSFFNVISLATTTGFISAPFDKWPSYVPLLISLLAIVGGCAASTSGGVKVIRAILLFKQSKREIAKLIHPNAIINIKFGHHGLPEDILQAMWGFISVFIALFLALMVLLVACGNDFVTSFSAITASLANAGAGIGQISQTFANLNAPSKWILIFAMLAGRLEIFSLLVLFSPNFWRK